VDVAIEYGAISRTSSRVCSSSKRLARFARSPIQDLQLIQIPIKTLHVDRRISLTRQAADCEATVARTGRHVDVAVIAVVPHGRQIAQGRFNVQNSIRKIDESCCFTIVPKVHTSKLVRTTPHFRTDNCCPRDHVQNWIAAPSKLNWWVGLGWVS